MSFWDALDRGGDAIGNFGGSLIDLYGEYKSIDEVPTTAETPERTYEPTGENWRPSSSGQVQTAGPMLPMGGVVLLAVLGFLVFQAADDG